jgi:streptogramin lyase
VGIILVSFIPEEAAMLWPFRRRAVRPANPCRFRPRLTALEDRWVPSAVTEFPLPPFSFAGNYPAAITGGPDGNLWFTDPALGEVGRITPAGQVTEFTPPSPDNGPSRGAGDAITAGPDGNVWFAAGSLFAAVSRVTPDGQFATFDLPGTLVTVNGLTAGPDGNVWFTENVYPFTVENVGFITPTGKVTSWSIAAPPGVRGTIGSITTGPDGNLWFTHDGTLATITPTGVLRDHVADGVGGALTTGPDGNLWASGPRWDTQTHLFAGDFIERITLAGSVTTFSVGPASVNAGSIAAGPDGNVWFTEPDANQIGRITPTGQITLFNVPTAGTEPTGIAAGPNGNIWFTEAASRQIGEYFLTGTPPAPAAATTTALAVDVGAPQVGQPVRLTATVASAAGTPTGTVTFFDGTSAIGTASLDAGGRAVLATVFKTSGGHGLTAVFNGTADFAPSRSAALQETVSRAVTTTTPTASANPAPVGHQLVLTVTVTPAFPGAGAPTGTVILRDGSNTLAFGTLDANGRATFTFIPGQVVRRGRHRVTILPRGLHHLSVSYTGDGDFNPSVSATLDLTVV